MDLAVVLLQLIRGLWRSGPSKTATVLVNAAVVGGFRDERRNHAIIVDI